MLSDAEPRCWILSTEQDGIKNRELQARSLAAAFSGKNDFIFSFWKGGDSMVEHYRGHDVFLISENALSGPYENVTNDEGLFLYRHRMSEELKDVKNIWLAVLRMPPYMKVNDHGKSNE